MLRSWIVQYRHAGATRRMTLGPDGGAQRRSRHAARRCRRWADVANGTDPQADRQDRRDKDRRTFKSVVADYLAIKKRDVRAPHLHREDALSHRQRYFGPLHGLALDQITRADVASRLNRISVESSSIVAALARAQLSALFAWALTQGLTEANPVIGTAHAEGRQAARACADATTNCGASGRRAATTIMAACIKLLILTGCRRQEIGGMCWSEFDDLENPTVGRCQRRGPKTTTPIRCR